MVFDAVVSPKVKNCLPSWQAVGNHGPPVPDLVMHLEKHFLFLERPLTSFNPRVQMVVVSMFQSTSYL